MCSPIAGLGAQLAVSLFSGITGHLGQQAQAEANIKYQQAQAKAHNAAMLQTAQSAIREQTEQSAAERVTQIQEQAATGQQVFDLRTERLRRQGEALASSQASGTALDMLLADYSRVEAQKKDVMQEQLRMQGVQHDFAVNSMKDRADSRIKSQSGYIPAPVSTPSWGLTALGIGGGMAGKLIDFDWKTLGGDGGAGKTSQKK